MDTRVALHVSGTADAVRDDSRPGRGPAAPGRRRYGGAATGTTPLPARLSTARLESRDKGGAARPWWTSPYCRHGSRGTWPYAAPGHQPANGGWPGCERA